MVRPAVLALVAAISGFAAPGLAASDPESGWLGFPGGATSMRDEPTHLRGLRLSTPAAPNATLLDGAPAAPFAPGVVLTIGVADVDGDGTDELIQARGSPSAPLLALADASTGAIRWFHDTGTGAFSVVPVPAAWGGPGRDLLVFLSFGSGRKEMRLYGGSSGSQAWSITLSPTNLTVYLGLARDGSRYDAVTGAWSIRAGQDPRCCSNVTMTATFWSLRTGSSVGGTTLQGSYSLPSAVPAPDIDADGIDDLYALQPVSSAVGAPSSGVLTALTQRGATRAWATAVSHPTSDHTFVIDARDLTGDPTPDAVLLGLALTRIPPVRELGETVTVVDGGGGAAGGLRPTTSVSLDYLALTFTAPGDLNRDGKEDIVMSGWRNAGSRQAAVFDAVGGGGRLWRRAVEVSTDPPNLALAYWADAGDLSGDGRSDAIAIVTATDVTLGEETAIDQSDGSVLWSRTDLGAGLTIPLGVDLDGDGGTDVLDRLALDLTDESVVFTGARGRDLAPLWDHRRALDLRTPFLGFQRAAGRFGACGEPGVVLEYVQQGGHFQECLRGATGEAAWTDP